MSADPTLEPDCRTCEDWGTIVLADDRDMPKALEFCSCAKGLEQKAKAEAKQALTGRGLGPVTLARLTQLLAGLHALGGEDLYAHGSVDRGRGFSPNRAGGGL